MMPIRYTFLILLVVAIWGFNFAVIKLGLQELTPIELCTLRFFLATVPLVFFIKRPAIPIYKIFIYACFIFILQFLFLFMSIKSGMPAGLAALLLQNQVFFSLFIAYFAFNETISRTQLFGACLAGVGILIMASHLDGELTGSGVALVLLAALCWSLGSLYVKTFKVDSAYSLTIWGSLLAWPPLLLITYGLEGWEMLTHIQQMGMQSWFAVIYIVYLSTLVGYGSWNRCLQHYSVSKVVPFTLLMPVFGMIGSAWILNEPMQAWKIVAGGFVIGGLAINIMSKKLIHFVHLYQKKTLKVGDF